MTRFSIILALSFCALFSCLDSYGEDPKSTSEDIILTTERKEIKPVPHRAPSHIDIHAYYDTNLRTINIETQGNNEGEVSLYLNGNLIETAFSINNVFQIELPGIYEIDIKTESWTAYGMIDLTTEIVDE